MNRVHPDDSGRAHDDASGEIAEDDARADSEIDEGGFQPSKMVMTVFYQSAVNPPSRENRNTSSVIISRHPHGNTLEKQEIRTQ